VDALAPAMTAVLTINIQKKFSGQGAAAFELTLAEKFLPGFTVIFGPSGAGKSTILDCVAGLLKPDAGWISLDDELFFDAAQKIFIPPQQRRVAYVLQSLALFPHLTVEANVKYGIVSLSGEERSLRTERILSAFHIENLRKRKPGELSGGEKQRVALARSLVTQPRVLLLDEPLTGLDAALRQAILRDLRAWNEANGIPILYVTHNRDETDAIGERMVALANGRVVDSGAPREVLDAPRSLAVARSVGFENVLRGEVLERRVADGVMKVRLAQSSCELEVPLSAAKEGISVQIAIRAGDILLANEIPRGLSARNILPGTLRSLEPQGSMMVAVVDAGARFNVHITPEAVRALKLRSQLAVWLIVKTHSCHLVGE
jgi:molybdate transport system ATP-binding protein